MGTAPGSPPRPLQRNRHNSAQRRERRAACRVRRPMTDASFPMTATPSDALTPAAHVGIHADPGLRRQIEEALDLIRPYLMADGGSVRLLGVTPEMVVELELLGACGTCPMSTMTLRAGIEQALKRSVPGITRVEAVSGR